MSNDQELDPRDLTDTIIECSKHGIHIWHVNDGNDFMPVYPLGDVLRSIKGDSLLPRGATTVTYNHDAVIPYLRYFNWLFVYFEISMPPLPFQKIILPKAVVTSFEKLLKKHSLAKYSDLLWFLLIRLQIRYTQRIKSGIIGSENYTRWISESKSNVDALIKIIDQVYNRSEIAEFKLSMNRQSERAVIEDEMLISFMIMSFAKDVIQIDRGQLPHNWKDIVRKKFVDGNEGLKENLQYIHRDFSLSFIEFLRCEHLTTDESILSTIYLNPITDILRLSSYPFLKSGEIEPKHIQSILFNTLPKKK